MITTTSRAAEAANTKPRLGCRPLAIQLPRVRLLPHVERKLGHVDPLLRETFRSLIEGEVPWPFYLHGPTGRGKTCGVLALSDSVITAGFWSVEDLCRQTMAAGGGDQMWHDVQTKELATLDELGARQKVGDLEYSCLKRFLDLREQHAGRIGIYIGNVEPSAIAKLYDDRIASRLLCGTVYRLTGKDRRRA